MHPERTFLEKVCLLHEEFLKEPEKWRHERLSRHPYDLHKIKGTVHGKAALQDKELFQIIVGHREKFTAIRGITYEKHTYAEIDFVPPDSVIHLWKEDYEKMLQTMIYGPAPTFEELVDSMKELRQWFRNQK